MPRMPEFVCSTRVRPAPRRCIASITQPGRD
jgi:hypothetical protein